jgi:hypothetical protein
VGLLDETLHYAMDLDLWIRLSKICKFHYVDQVFANYLIHPASKSGSGAGFEKFFPEWKLVAERHIEKASFLERFRFSRDRKKAHLSKGGGV